MKVLKRMFTTIVPWYDEKSENNKDMEYHSICSSARVAIHKAENIVSEYRADIIPTSRSKEHIPFKR